MSGLSLNGFNMRISFGSLPENSRLRLKEFTLSAKVSIFKAYVGSEPDWNLKILEARLPN
jgi:hypothetical protein